MKFELIKFEKVGQPPKYQIFEPSVCIHRKFATFTEDEELARKTFNELIEDQKETWRLMDDEKITIIESWEVLNNK